MIAIIGSGPAGVSAALYLKRANKDVVVFTNHKSSLLEAKNIENYYGVGNIDGKKLYKEGIEELNNLNIKIIEEDVFNITFENNITVETNKQKYGVDYVVIATGSAKKKPKINNLDKFEGSGISYCATCDGFFFKNKTVAVLGNNNFAIHELKYLENITKDLILLTNGNSAIYSKYKSITKKIKSVEGNTTLTNIKFDDNSSLNIDGLFIVLDSPDSNILAKKCGILTETNHIIVNDKFETNIPGIYACGDAIKGPKQISKAVYEGMMVATNIITNINKKN